MSVIVLIVIFILLISFLSGRIGNREAPIGALIILSFLTVVITETLSFFILLTQQNLLIAWSLIGVILFILIIRFQRGKVKFPAKFWGLYSYPEFYAITFLALGSLVTCLFAYPNNWDSMTYHLSRVGHWIQNESVAHYATNNVRQISQPPLAEYWITHLHLLSGFEKSANLVQWIAYTGTIMVGGSIASLYQTTARNTLRIMLIIACIPMALLQSNSTQNDMVTAFFLLCTMYYVLKALRQSSAKTTIILLSLSAALALCSKGTAYIFILPILTYYAIGLIRSSIRLVPVVLLTGVMSVLLINGLHWKRNIETFGDWTGKDTTLQNESYGLQPTLSTLSKNVAMEAGTPFKDVNQKLTGGVGRFHSLLKTDMYDSKLNWGPSPAFEVPMYSIHEDYAGALGIGLLLVSVLFIWLFKKQFKPSKASFFFTIAFSMLVLFSILLKWQIWHNRLHLTIWVFVAIGLGFAITNWKSVFQVTGISLIFIIGVGTLVFNASRPWLGKDSIFTTYSYDQYFNNNMDLLPSFLQMSGVIQREQISTLGLATSGDAWEYPFRIINENIELEHILVDNTSKRYELDLYIPEGIVSNRDLDVADGFLILDTRQYYLAYERGDWKLFLPVIN